MNKYPYPVLAFEASSYKEDISYEIVFLRNINMPGEIAFEFDIKMESQYLKTLIENNMAKIVMKVTTGLYSQCFEISNLDSKFQCTVETGKLKSNDQLKFTSYILANERIELIHNDELISVYDEDYKVSVEKNSILGVSNTETLSYSTSNNDFIKFSVAEELKGRGYKIEYRSNNINILVGPEMNLAYGVMKNNNREVCAVFDSHIVFEVFVYTLIELINHYDEYKDETWCTMFEQVLCQAEESYESFELYCQDVKDDGCILIDKIYETAHKMINNQIEHSIIVASKYEEA